MGSFHGAEVCELVGLFILSKLLHLNLNLGLYRDDALGVCQLTPRQVEIKKKEICKILKTLNLSITIQANMKIVDFLDVTLNLNDGTFKPFMKPNDFPLYVNSNSNHPPSILKNIPKSVNRRLSKISSNEQVFKDSIPPFQEALEKSGYSHTLKYEKINNKNKKNNRKRPIIWFNPPFSCNVSTNVGGKFLKILDKCFPPSNPLHKIINRNKVKISYRKMPNMKENLGRHNMNVNKNECEQQFPHGCNCRGGVTECPLEGSCLTPGVVYQATVTTHDGNPPETYTGLTAGQFKNRYNKHSSDFNNEKQKKSTELSKHVWKLKEKNTPHSISWKIIAKTKPFTPYNPTRRSCQLCLKEKYCIMFRPEGASLNSRNEIFSTCRHRRKELLENT